MKIKNRRKIAFFLVVAAFTFFGIVKLANPKMYILAQTNTSPAAEFKQTDAIAKLKEQIKGKEKEPAEKVFKNIQMLKGIPAGRLLAIMEMGYARSLGVNCTHCHVAEKWESEEKPQKQIAREMAAMVGKINGEYLKNIKNLKSAAPTVNCTTCHRGQVKPALNLPMAK